MSINVLLGKRLLEPARSHSWGLPAPCPSDLLSRLSGGALWRPTWSHVAEMIFMQGAQEVI